MAFKLNLLVKDFAFFALFQSAVNFFSILNFFFCFGPLIYAPQLGQSSGHLQSACDSAPHTVHFSSIPSSNLKSGSNSTVFSRIKLSKELSFSPKSKFIKFVIISAKKIGRTLGTIHKLPSYLCSLLHCLKTFISLFPVSPTVRPWPSPRPSKTCFSPFPLFSGGVWKCQRTILSIFFQTLKKHIQHQQHSLAEVSEDF